METVLLLFDKTYYSIDLLRMSNVLYRIVQWNLKFMKSMKFQQYSSRNARFLVKEIAPYPILHCTRKGPQNL